MATPLALAAVGLFHPTALNADTAPVWVWMHVCLLPVFPLLALGFVVPLRGRFGPGVPGVASVVAWAGAFAYACCYTGLDAVAGIAAGTVWRHAPPSTDPGTIVAPLYRTGDDLGRVGVTAFLVAVVATCVGLYREARLRVLPGGVVLLVAGWSFLDSHIFRPRGVVTMIGLAIGFALLTAAATGGADRRRGGAGSR